MGGTEGISGSRRKEESRCPCFNDAADSRSPGPGGRAQVEELPEVQWQQTPQQPHQYGVYLLGHGLSRHFSDGNSRVCR